MQGYDQVPGEQYLFRHSDGTYVFTKEMSKAVFRPIQKTVTEKFTDLCDREITSADIVGNGPIYDTSSTISYYAGLPIDPKDINTRGLVYIGGKKVDGIESKLGFYINFDGQYHFGEGNPPTPFNAFGGLGPLIVKDYRPSTKFPRPVIFNDVNVYDKNVESSPPPKQTGDPYPEQEDNLLRRSSATISSYSAGQGIMAIGTSSATGLLHVLIREEGVSYGSETRSAIEHFRQLQCDNAVFLDGSTSITCRTKLKYYAEPDKRKNNSIEIGFKIS
ncbi:hypothetical protein [Agrobacterium vitis]|uniref:Phosphodiester glycosidase domain-containing protein n=1 Tax=Agrobacterium vitis TaxID=373 RepID=A0AAE2RF60_AGRVI|nr:hypothetical protein [Agrobacterium vitis]MBF2715327.1 hypothetical protein [Agrobacterium vitis]MVA17814.1 hypothetical protein [Agrobacterium vitis]